ncbi:TPA: hypothetical protein DDZ86_03975 [Candidatus Dependentiae bacterium]|nr:hypothetical protein [Candidatus Dependentiae bacterium]
MIKFVSKSLLYVSFLCIGLVPFFSGMLHAFQPGVRFGVGCGSCGGCHHHHHHCDWMDEGPSFGVGLGLPMPSFGCQHVTTTCYKKKHKKRCECCGRRKKSHKVKTTVSVMQPFFSGPILGFGINFPL